MKNKRRVNKSAKDPLIRPRTNKYDRLGEVTWFEFVLPTEPGDGVSEDDTQQIRWSDGIMYSVTARDCEWAAWHFERFGLAKTHPFWQKLRDIMLHG